MAADLQPAGIGPDPVRVVDDRRGQPEHLALDLGQCVQAGGFPPAAARVEVLEIRPVPGVPPAPFGG